MTPSLPRAAADFLHARRDQLARATALIGFDGFVDTILHVVDKRTSSTQYTRLAAMTAFAKRLEAAAGQSANFEFVTQMVKLGGNGPIMAHALSGFGPATTYIGNLGRPSLHPVFADFARETKVHTLAEPGYTDAIEFEDGKLMFGKHASLHEVNWPRILEVIPLDRLTKLIGGSSLVALVNWTMLPHMTAIFKKLLTQVAPKLSGERRWLFFDLADPAKRTAEDIAELLRIIMKFEKYFRVILGLNLQESRQIGTVLGLPEPEESHEPVAQHAAAIRAKLNVDTVVIHPTHFAGAADASGAAHVGGPYTPAPLITTGAGDHFNAGFCIGRLLGADVATSLQIGVGTSGYYVRKAASPKLHELVRFLRSLPDDSSAR